MRVRCISPHGGGHHGIRADNEEWAAEGYEGPLLVPPNEGGYVSCPALSYQPVAVGSELDAPEDFVPDGYHFEAVTGSGDPPPPPPDPGLGGVAELLGKGDA